MARFIPLAAAIWLLSTAAAAEENAVVVPALISLSGDAAQFGRGELDGYTLAAEEWNARGGIGGKRIQLEVEDAATSQMRRTLCS